ncbi:hypothetical protein EJ04DRAFT_568841 [Polyplosphaeria fusca]|uniref:Uncharacterized protein n=1 Tax=Polyplosphaeria fusca TaxID=682080 RepID=A0A9P4QKW6_9PLEO|nr:hypothetical protein EJ04DRAFT_568841 [Polyplosphaeria fusca]
MATAARSESIAKETPADGGGRSSFATYAEYVETLKSQNNLHPAAYNALLRNPESLKSFLRDANEAVACQIVLLDVGLSRLPPTWIVDAIGLGLDIDPGIWAFFLPQSSIEQNGGQAPQWMRRSDFIAVGRDALLVLGAIPNIRPMTAVIFLFSESTYRRNLATEAAYSVMHNADAPSTVQDEKADVEAKGGELDESRDDAQLRAIRRWILNAQAKPSEVISEHTVLSRLESLLRWQISQAPHCIPEYTNFGSEPHQKHRYSWGLGGRSEMRHMWLSLRKVVHSRKLTLLALSDFIDSNLDLTDAHINKMSKQLERTYGNYVKELEAEEQMLRDYIM